MDFSEKCTLDRAEIKELVYEAISYSKLRDCLQSSIIKGSLEQLDFIVACIMEAQYCSAGMNINGKYVRPDDVANILFQARWFHVAFILSRLSASQKDISAEHLTQILYTTVAKPALAYRYRVNFQKRHWDIRFE